MKELSTIEDVFENLRRALIKTTQKVIRDCQKEEGDFYRDYILELEDKIRSLEKASNKELVEFLIKEFEGVNYEDDDVDHDDNSYDPEEVIIWFFNNVIAHCNS